MPTAARGQKRWIESAERRLEPVMLAALRLRVALDVARDSPHPANILEDAGAPLLAASADLLTWLQRAAVPKSTGMPRSSIQGHPTWTERVAKLALLLAWRCWNKASTTSPCSGHSSHEK
jgi:hypothetical protein